MRRCQANLPNRCCRHIDRVAYRAFDGEQWMDREGRAATTGNTYCGNLLWQSGLTLLAPNPALAPATGAQRFGSAALNDIMIDVNANTPSGVERVNGWPSMGSYTDRWCHSDMKDVSYFFNFKFYQKVVEKGELR